MTQRLPDVTSRRGCFALGFACTEYNWSEDGFLYLSRHEHRQQLCMPPSGLLHIHHSWPPSLSKEGVKSKSRHETARGRAKGTGQDPRPCPLSPPSQGVGVPVRTQSPEGTSEHRAEKASSYKSLASVGRSQVLLGEQGNLWGKATAVGFKGIWSSDKLSHFRVLRTGLWPRGPLKCCQVAAGMSYARGKGTWSSFSFIITWSPGIGTWTPIPLAGQRKAQEKRIWNR